jgi:multimeric flavodoxin WrbA
MLDADGYLFGTTANLGYTSGALKHFFDTVYYPSLDHVAGRPYGLWVHGNNDTAGAANAVDKVATRARPEQGRRRARSHRCNRRSRS